MNRWKKYMPIFMAMLFLNLLSGCGSVGVLPPPDVPVPSRIVDINGKLITVVSQVNRVPVPLDQIAPEMQDAIVAIEDSRFYQHHGIDPEGLMRAVIKDLSSGKMVEGGSTITQQLAKNLYLGPQKTIDRKFKEIYYTFQLERRYTKKEILNMYLNQIYFGQGAYGIEAAARTYFNKPASQLDLAESAMLAGIPRMPGFYSPTRNFDNAKARQNVVLGRMVELHMINQDQAQTAQSEYIQPVKRSAPLKQAPYFVNEIIKHFEQKYPDAMELLYAGGLTVSTTLDLRVQEAAEKALVNGLNQMNPEINGAMVAIDPHTGYIKAMVGGRDFNASQYNRVLAVSQPGSAFKPFLYAAALDNGYTAASTLFCEPITYWSGGQPYTPKDYEGGYQYRPLTLKEALYTSDNVVSVQLASRLGPDKIVQYAKSMGVTSPLRAYLSLALGTSEVTPLEMARAYGPLANQGIRTDPLYILKVTDPDGKALEDYSPKLAKVIDDKTAYIVTDMLKSVIQPGGTAGQVGAMINRPAAGKTGTTEDSQDAWFVGYTPDIVASVYVGYDDKSKKVGLTGGEAAAPIWADFISQALSGLPAKDFTRPEGVVMVDISARDGSKAGPYTTGPIMNAAFVKGTEPMWSAGGDQSGDQEWSLPELTAPLEMSPTPDQEE